MKKGKPGCRNRPGFREVQELSSNPFTSSKMKKDQPRTEFELRFKLRVPPELIKWLAGFAGEWQRPIGSYSLD